MNVFRKLLFPFAILYQLATGIRNWLYDRQVLKSSAFGIPVIAVGNLSVGGTGKSPHVEYLIRLLSSTYKVAVLSRGYKRASKGFVLADVKASAETLGDEPFQFYRKFSNIVVAVDADRSNGIRQLLAIAKPDVILLDDAFQHRKVKAGFYVLLTAYNDLYADDFILPMGNLRESRRGSGRADAIVVTKCPPELSEAEMRRIGKKLAIQKNQQLFFSFIDYDEHVFGESQTLSVQAIRNEKKTLIAGIAKPKPFFNHLHHEGDTILEFPDHHAFADSEINTIRNASHGRKIITTEKDYVRLQGRNLEHLYYLPIRSTFLADGEKFDKTILDYVGKSPANRSVH